MTYSHITYAQFKTALAGRLGDVSKTFWIDLELGEHIKEALRTFNSIAQFHYISTTFPTQSGFAFYDLTLAANPDLITAGTGSSGTNPPAYLSYSLTDRNLINILQYHLMEHVTTNWAGGWAGTDQFVMDDLTRAIERARNLFLYLTGSHITHSQIAYSDTSLGKLTLSESVTMVRRASWKTLAGIYSPLWRTDETEMAQLYHSWSTPVATVPESYSVSISAPNTLQIIPISSVNGTVDILSINSPANLDDSTGILLNIPDDFSWIIKYKALADLLFKEGQAYDPARAAYCQKRFEEGVRIAALTANLGIRRVIISNSNTQPVSLSDLDSYVHNWQNVSGAPTDLAIAGNNLIALSPVPDGVYTIKLDILRNAPMPVNDADNVQIGKEHIDSILDYATHLAMFKKEGPEFFDTMPLVDNFMQQAMMHNELLRAEARNYTIMRDYNKKEEVDRKRFSKDKELQEE